MFSFACSWVSWGFYVHGFGGHKTAPEATDEYSPSSAKPIGHHLHAVSVLKYCVPRFYDSKTVCTWWDLSPPFAKHTPVMCGILVLGI